MQWKRKSWMLVGVLLAAYATGASAQVATTQIADTVYLADGTAATGTVLIHWSAFTTSAGVAVPTGSTSATIGTGGALSVQLVPNAGANPVGSYYTVVYHLGDGSVSRQYWVVPVSGTAVRISAIASSVLPLSVALQTVSKSYVDAAIAAAIAALSSGGSGTAAVTIEHSFSTAGTFDYAHGLGTLYPLMTCYVNSGATTYTAANVDANNIAITVTAASDITCTFGK